MIAQLGPKKLQPPQKKAADMSAKSAGGGESLPGLDLAELENVAAPFVKNKCLPSGYKV